MLEASGITVAGRLADAAMMVEAGRITAICGPNGAGKSTLLSVLAGLLQPKAGQVLFDGCPLGAMAGRERARAIGYLPQDSEVAWDLSVRSLVSLGRLPHDTGPEQDRRAVDGALAALSLEHLADRPLSSLSGGERSRALLARVLAGEPRCVLADEPLASLDLAHQAGLLQTFRTLADEGRAVVLVLHDLAAAMNHADQVIVLQQGRIAGTGAPEEVLAEQAIAEIWGIECTWLGAPGQRALAISGASDPERPRSA